MLLQLLFLSVIATICKTTIPATEEYPHQAVLGLEGKMILYWKFDETTITFELHGNSLGWIGMGISPNGTMARADIALGWVKNGVATLTDRVGQTSMNGYPIKDLGQNIELLEGMESNGWTAIKFRRPLAASEADFDLPITNDTLNIIFAFGDSDPAGDDIDGSYYHNSNRGAITMILLIPSEEENTEEENTTTCTTVTRKVLITKVTEKITTTIITEKTTTTNTKVESDTSGAIINCSSKGNH